MPALTDRRYGAVCTNHRRLTGKVLHGAHLKILLFLLGKLPSFYGTCYNTNVGFGLSP